MTDMCTLGRKEFAILCRSDYFNQIKQLAPEDVFDYWADIDSHVNNIAEDISLRTFISNTEISKINNGAMELGTYVFFTIINSKINMRLSIAAVKLFLSTFSTLCTLIRTANKRQNNTRRQQIAAISQQRSTGGNHIESGCL